ncbi:MAG: DUF1521 domain-containing protein [Chloroflexi bacterium]|nr:DUF1521 domain-containing protein [Chloroflexota bacterium]
MPSILPNDISNMMIARRLMIFSQEVEARRNGKHVHEKTALDYYEEDQAFISDSASAANKQNPTPQPPVENLNINLSDLNKNVQEIIAVQKQATQPVQEAFKLEASQSVEVTLELRYRSNAPVDGLIVHDQNFAESDRYLFNFKDGTTFTILDKWTNKSTTVWGDPHVDVDDVDGESNGDFKDLKSSDDFTTFMLKDGTRLTFNAKDSGIIEQVDIFKGSQHVKGLGQAAKEFSAETGLFSKNVLADGSSAANSTLLGDVVYAGGDGNDWFDANDKLIWGKTTGPVVTQRPPAVLEFSYRQTVTQSISIQTIARTA